MEDVVQYHPREDLQFDTSSSARPVRAIFDPHTDNHVRVMPVAPMQALSALPAATQTLNATTLGLAPVQYQSVGTTSQVVSPSAEEFLSAHTNYLQTQSMSRSVRRAQFRGLPNHYGIV